MVGAGPEPNKPYWDSVRKDFESKFYAVPERKTLTDFIKTNKEILTIIGGFSALAVFFSTNPINKPSLAFLSLLMVFILFLEFLTKFSEMGNSASFSLNLFYMLFIVFLLDLSFSICLIYKDLILEHLFLGLFILFWVTYIDFSIKKKVRKIFFTMFLYLIRLKPFLNFISSKQVVNLLQNDRTLSKLFAIYWFFVIIFCGILAYLSSIVVSDILKIIIG
jgi:hypothetical protein